MDNLDNRALVNLLNTKVKIWQKLHFCQETELVNR